MKKNKDIKIHNNKGQKHGYWGVYRYTGKLWSKGNYYNGKQIGYWEYYNYGNLWRKKYYII